MENAVNESAWERAYAGVKFYRAYELSGAALMAAEVDDGADMEVERAAEALRAAKAAVEQAAAYKRETSARSVAAHMRASEAKDLAAAAAAGAGADAAAPAVPAGAAAAVAAGAPAAAPAPASAALVVGSLVVGKSEDAPITVEDEEEKESV